MELYWHSFFNILIYLLRYSLLLDHLDTLSLVLFLFLLLKRCNPILPISLHLFDLDSRNLDSALEINYPRLRISIYLCQDNHINHFDSISKLH
jgi:hypothetical protein